MFNTILCPYCGKYLTTQDCEETRLNNLYKTNNTSNWARSQLKILLDMAEDHNLPEFYKEELKRIINGLYITK